MVAAYIQISIFVKQNKLNDFYAEFVNMVDFLRLYHQATNLVKVQSV